MTNIIFQIRGENRATYTHRVTQAAGLYEMRFLLARRHPVPWKVGSTASMCSIAGAHTHAACLSIHKVRHHPGKSGKRGVEGRTAGCPAIQLL